MGTIAKADIEIAGYNPAEVQRCSIRDSMVILRFFDSLNELLTLEEYNEADIQKKVEIARSTTSDAYSKLSRLDPAMSLFFEAVVCGATAAASWWGGVPVQSNGLTTPQQ